MKKIGLIGLVLALGILLGTSISPLRAQSPGAEPQAGHCYVGESSGAACAGKWVFFASALNFNFFISGIYRVDAALKSLLHIF